MSSTFLFDVLNRNTKDAPSAVSAQVKNPAQRACITGLC